MQSAKILVVDDEPAIAELVCAILDLSGWQTRTAYCGDEALDCVQHWRPDAIVLDLMLPDRHGLEVCRLIRSDPAHDDVRILVLTASLQPDVREASLRAGSQRCLGKPFDAAELLGEVTRLLE